MNNNTKKNKPFTKKDFNWTVIKVTKRTDNIPTNTDVLKDIDLTNRLKEKTFNTWTSSDDEFDLLANDIPQPEESIKDKVEFFFWWIWLWITMNADIVWWVIVLVLFIWWASTLFAPVDPAKEASKLQKEIERVQSLYIEQANKELESLVPQRDLMISKLSNLNNTISLYDKCIIANTEQTLPVPCDTISITLKDTLNWKVNANWQAQEIKPLTSEWLDDRMEELLSMYPAVSWHLDTFIKLGKVYNIKPEVVIAIAKADSSLWNELKTNNNIGNVGNNDRWDTVAFDSIEKWIEAIYKTLNNKYLWDIYNIGYLSEWGRITLWGKSCSLPNEYCYATSTDNWNNNVINTLRLLHNDPSIDESFNFRTNHM